MPEVVFCRRFSPEEESCSAHPCGKQIPDTARTCNFCGKPVTAGARGPVGAVQPRTRGMAIASLIFGLMFLFFPAAIVAVVLGHLSRSKIRNSGGQLTGAGLGLAGLVLGYMGIAIIPILIIAAIAIPNLLRARIAANEASSVGSLRTPNTALMHYRATYGAGFPSTLVALGPPAPAATASVDAAGLIDSTLASGTRHGYAITYSPADTDGDGVFEAYTINADPLQPGRTGLRHFFSDQTGVIRYESERRAHPESPPL